jgi:hypothetical protein
MTRRAHGEGSLLRRKGCKLWYAQFYKDGRRVRVPTGESVRQKALSALRRLMGDCERGLPLSTDLKKIMYATASWAACQLPRKRQSHPPSNGGRRGDNWWA